MGVLPFEIVAIACFFQPMDFEQVLIPCFLSKYFHPQMVRRSPQRYGEGLLLRYVWSSVFFRCRSLSFN